MGDSDRPRKSWKEIDRARDGSGHRDDRDRPSPGGPRRTQRSQKSYRAALDRLFDSGKIGALMPKDGETAGAEGDAGRTTLLRQLEAAEGRDAITKAVDAFVRSYALPDDVDLLTKVLEHRDPQQQLTALRALLRMTEGDRPRRTRGLVGKLKLIREMADDPEIADLAAQLADRLD